MPAGDIDATERVMRDVFTKGAAYDALREKGRRDARMLTWERNAQTVEGIYYDAIDQYAKR